MGNTNNCINASINLHKVISSDDTLRDIITCDKHNGVHCFRVKFNSHIVTKDGQIVKGVSISYPPDAMGNRGLDYEELEIPETIETALIGQDEKLIYVAELGYSDIRRFTRYSELSEEIMRIYGCNSEI